MQEESDSEDKLKEVTTSFWSDAQEEMGNQAQRRSVLRIRRASSEETQQQQPSPPRELSHSGQLSPSASRSPPEESEYDFIGPFGKKQKILRAKLRLDESSGSETNEDTTTSAGSSSRTIESESPKGPVATRARQMTSSPLSAMSENVGESTVEPLNLSMCEESNGSRASRQVEESQNISPHTGMEGCSLSPREVSVITSTSSLAANAQQVRRPGRPTNASYAAEAAAAAASSGAGASGEQLPDLPGVSPSDSKGGKAKKKYKCEDCNKEFSQLRNFRYHRSRHEGTNQFACTCPICGKAFNDKGYLSSHLKIHKNAKEYKCEWCEKSFNQRVAYNMHVRIHTGHKPHQCHMCTKAFSRKMLLRQHLRTHTGERPYHCLACPKSFADRSNMLLHQRLHTGERPYRCEICGKTFSKNHHLKTHMNHHLGIRPYACPKCDSRFSQSSNMKTHLKKCTGVKQKPRASGTRSSYPQVGPEPVATTSSSSSTTTMLVPPVVMSAPMSPSGEGTSVSIERETELMNYLNPMVSIQANLATARSSPSLSWNQSEYAHYSPGGSGVNAMTTVIRGPSPLSRRRIPPTSTVTTDSSFTSVQPTMTLQQRGHTVQYGRGAEAAAAATVEHPIVSPYISSGGSRLESIHHFGQNLPLNIQASPPQPIAQVIRRLSPSSLIPIRQLVLASESFSSPQARADIHPSPLYSYSGQGNTSRHDGSSPYAGGSNQTISPPNATARRSPPDITHNFIHQLQQQQQLLHRHQHHLQLGQSSSSGSSAMGMNPRVLQLSPPRPIKREQLWEGEVQETRESPYQYSPETVRPAEYSELEMEDQRRESQFRELQQLRALQQQQRELQQQFGEQERQQRELHFRKQQQYQQQMLRELHHQQQQQQRHHKPSDRSPSPPK